MFSRAVLINEGFAKANVYRTDPEFSVLGKLPELANAYKHCVPYDPNARRSHQLHHTQVNISFSLGHREQASNTEIKFSGPLPDDHATVDAVFKFWLDYHQSDYTNPTTDELVNV